MDDFKDTYESSFELLSNREEFIFDVKTEIQHTLSLYENKNFLLLNEELIKLKKSFRSLKTILIASDFDQIQELNFIPFLFHLIGKNPDVEAGNPIDQSNENNPINENSNKANQTIPQNNNEHKPPDLDLDSDSSDSEDIETQIAQNAFDLIETFANISFNSPDLLSPDLFFFCISIINDRYSYFKLSALKTIFNLLKRNPQLYFSLFLEHLSIPVLQVLMQQDYGEAFQKVVMNILYFYVKNLTFSQEDLLSIMKLIYKIFTSDSKEFDLFIREVLLIFIVLLNKDFDMIQLLFSLAANDHSNNDDIPKQFFSQLNTTLFHRDPNILVPALNFLSIFIDKKFYLNIIQQELDFKNLISLFFHHNSNVVYHISNITLNFRTAFPIFHEQLFTVLKNQKISSFEKIVTSINACYSQPYHYHKKVHKNQYEEEEEEEEMNRDGLSYNHKKIFISFIYNVLFDSPEAIFAQFCFLVLENISGLLFEIEDQETLLLLLKLLDKCFQYAITSGQIQKCVKIFKENNGIDAINDLLENNNAEIQIVVANFDSLYRHCFEIN